MFCKKCGKQIEESQRYCQYCGYDNTISSTNQRAEDRQSYQQPQQPNVVVNNYAGPQYGSWHTPSPKDKTITLVLAILLGIIGVHRFYVGKVGTGILYFLSGGLLGIGWIVDIVKIASGTFTDGAGRIIS